MPSLRQTLAGHVRAGHVILVIIPEYYFFGHRLLRPPASGEGDFSVRRAPCPWQPCLKSLLALCDTHLGGRHLLRWLIYSTVNKVTWLLLTISLFLEAHRVRWRQGWRFDLVYAHCEYAALAGYLIGLAHRVANVTRLYGTFLADLVDKPFVWLRYPVPLSAFRIPHSLLICTNDGTRGDEVARKLGVDSKRFRFWTNGVSRPDGVGAARREDILAIAPRNLRIDSK